MAQVIHSCMFTGHRRRWWNRSAHEYTGAPAAKTGEGGECLVVDDDPGALGHENENGDPVHSVLTTHTLLFDNGMRLS